MTDEIILRVRGMVCARCIDVARTELNQAGFDVLDVQLGKLTLRGPLQASDLERINQTLVRQEFSLIQDQKLTIHQRAKSFIDAVFGQDDLSESKIGPAPECPHRPVSHRRTSRSGTGTTAGVRPSDRPNRRLSAQLQDALGLDYDTISGQFAKAEGVTLEKYIINRRIDKVKEWLVYSDESLTDIAYRTGYSSVQHLSNQFRQQTGLTPTYFRKIRHTKQQLQG